MERKNIPKNESGEITRREFLKDAGLVVGGAAIGSSVLLAACGGEVTTETVTQTATETATQTQTATQTTTVAGPTTTATATQTVPGPTTTATATATQEVSRFVCPSCGGEFETLALLKDHVKDYHPAEVPDVPKAKRFINVRPERCVGCEVCVLACSSHHEGVASRSLSRIRNDFDALAPTFYYPKLCLQCDYPECYFACPLKDEALCIDAETGVRYINEDKCVGCGICVDACPFDPPRISIDKGRMVALKCDLCRDRENGPACVEFCQTGALMLAGEGIEEEDIYGEEAPGIGELV